MTRKGQAPSEGCEQPLSFVMPGPCGPFPRGSAVRQMGCWQIDPCSYGSCQSAVRNSPKHPPLSAPRSLRDLPGCGCILKKNTPKPQIWAFRVIKCLNVCTLVGPGVDGFLFSIHNFRTLCYNKEKTDSISLKHQSKVILFNRDWPSPVCFIEHCGMASLLLCVQSQWDGDLRGNLSLTSFWLTGFSSEAQPIGLALIMTRDDGMLIRTDQALNSLSDAPGSLWGQR